MNENDMVARMDLEVAVGRITRYAAVLADRQATLARLLTAGTVARKARATDQDIEVVGKRWLGDTLLATVRSTKRAPDDKDDPKPLGEREVLEVKEYDTRITFGPRPSHKCDCPDWTYRAADVGPCKHVLAMGAGYSEWVRGEMVRVVGALDGITA